MAASSLLVFWVAFRRTRVAVSPTKLRVFKRETVTVSVDAGRWASRWVQITSVVLSERPGLTGEVSGLRSSGVELSLIPTLAGRSEGFEATVRASDPLGLFTKARTVSLELVLEVLPLALKERPRQLVVPLLAYGEDPAGSSGSGQELYAVSEYQPGLDPRDIMWKRVAGMTDERLPVRVREANVRRAVSIGVRVGSRSEEERARRTDLVVEALGRVGMQLLGAGSVMEVTYPSPSAVRRVVVSSPRELADATTLPWVAGRGASWGPSLSELSFDLLIIGQYEATTPSVAALPRSRKLLVISEDPLRASSPAGAYTFTGREDLSDVASMVISG
jgi:uncharacterized protein (DUF58 family)